MPKNDTSSRSWFCVQTFKDLEKVPEYLKEYVGTNPQKVCELMAEKWISGGVGRSGSWVYCVSAEGLHHVHNVLESVGKTRFSAVKKAFPGMHVEPTQGTKKDVVDYIEKKGRFAEKGEQILYTYTVGEIEGKQGYRSDLNMVQQLISEGLTPREILDSDPNFYRLSSYLQEMFYAKKLADTPPIRDVSVFWHFGETGTGKTMQAFSNIEKKGRENVFYVTAENRSPFDNYVAQSELWIDELRQDSPYFTFPLMLNVLDKYTAEIPCRYKNSLMLWNEVHVLSPLLPYEVYDNLMNKHDKIAQLLRRVRYYVYHYKDDFGVIKNFTLDTKNSGQFLDRTLIVNQARMAELVQADKKSPEKVETSPALGVVSSSSSSALVDEFSQFF